MYFIYFIGLIIILYLVFTIYFKLKYKFWSKQPVFHFHKLHYWLLKPSIITNKFEYNRFYNMKNIIFKKFDDVTSIEFNRFCNFIKKYYLREKNEVEFIPSEEYTKAYFEGHNEPCYLTYIKNNKYLLDNKKNINTIENIDCALTSRPLNVYFKNNNNPIYIKMNYVDYLCTHKDKRKKGLAPQLIYTYAINSSNNNKEINTYIFKRESSSTAIVPLTTFNTYLYDINKITKKEDLLPYKLVLINNNNFSLIYKYLFKNVENECLLSKEFEVYIISSISNIKNLVEKGILKIYVLMMDDILYGIYIFRNSEVLYNNYKAIDLVCSCNYYKNRENIKEKELIYSKFIKGFYRCIEELKEEDYKRVVIENIADNIIINKEISKKNIGKNVSSYYLYNYRKVTEYSKDCFMLF